MRPSAEEPGAHNPNPNTNIRIGQSATTTRSYGNGKALEKRDVVAQNGPTKKL